MKNRVRGFVVLAGFSVAAFVLCTGISLSQGNAGSQAHTLSQGQIIVPESSVERPEDIGKRAHTNHLIFQPAKEGIVLTTPSGETPGSIACIYQLPPYKSTDLANGCLISTSTSPTTGGGGTIAIVDAFDYPTAENDFTVFSNQFGLPSGDTCGNGTQTCFRKVYATGTQPRLNCGWAQEAALDIEWAHSMAPLAQIVLVEAASNSFTDLLQAVDVATNEVTSGSTNKGEVSMSWGGREFSSETGFDSHFTGAGVVYFAASGDTGGVPIYPSTSPDVVSCGGTTIVRDASGKFVDETAWSGSGGGPSAFESRPSYQDGIMSIVGGARGTPDFSLDSNPSSGVAVYDSTPCHGLSGWLRFGGTSVATQALAGIVNSAASFSSSTGDELTTIYNCYANTTPNCYTDNFRDITSGTAGKGKTKVSAETGWDFVTGVGSNVGLNGK